MHNKTKQDIGAAITELMALYGKLDRAYSVTFPDDCAKWRIDVVDTEIGESIAVLTQD